MASNAPSSFKAAPLPRECHEAMGAVETQRSAIALFGKVVRGWLYVAIIPGS